MKVLELRLKPSNGKPLKGFCDIELDDGTVIKDMRIVQKQADHRPFVMCPQNSWKDPLTGEVKFKTVITLPAPLKTKIDALILSAWIQAKEKEDEENRKSR